MKISVVIPSFNDIRILETIESIKNQNYPQEKIELIVQDSLSSEEISLKIKNSLSANDKYISEKDNGIFDGINKGLMNATGDIILTLGTDDRVKDDDLFSEVEKKFNEGFNFIFCDLEYTNADWKPIRKWPARQFTYTNYLLGRQYAHFSLFCTKSIYKKLGYFNTSNLVNADYEFFHQALREQNRIGINSTIIKNKVVQMKLGGNSSRNIKKIIASNFIMLSYVIKNDARLLPGFLFKPFHKIVEAFSAKI